MCYKGKIVDHIRSVLEHKSLLGVCTSVPLRGTHGPEASQTHCCIVLIDSYI